MKTEKLWFNGLLYFVCPSEFHYRGFSGLAGTLEMCVHGLFNCIFTVGLSLLCWIKVLGFQCDNRWLKTEG